ncbi:hypothetical protein DPMN_030902 [Dreissena polymorpha]|uniref:Uncharacterized protein n=1 Tax=Dreissena polymorpha TaxID=45954 RepID=A0A9D4RGL3_DREPO|nr:hypothetical protein DPMN_030902 [Dreissena polymorpha]
MEVKPHFAAQRVGGRFKYLWLGSYCMASLWRWSATGFRILTSSGTLREYLCSLESDYLSTLCVSVNVDV